MKMAEARVGETQMRKRKAQSGAITVPGKTIAQQTAELAM
jgi:hypothetical protein